MNSGLLAVVVSVLAACGSGKPVSKGGPQTAAEKQRLEFEASGEEEGGGAGKWGAWKYKGDRDDCFYVIGRECFKTEKEACATCKDGQECTVEGGGPAVVTCE